VTPATSANTHLPQRLPSLTGIRIIAAVCVVQAHAFYAPKLYASATAWKALGALVPLATSSVTLFFVLSGLVLTWSARPTDTAFQFWRRRSVRIYSNHLAAWALAAVLALTYGLSVNLVSTSNDFNAGAQIAGMFLVHTWSPNITYTLYNLNPPTWSLACEAFFYLLFPYLLVPILRIPVGWLWRSAGLTVLACLSVPCLSLFLGGSIFNEDVPIPHYRIWFAYVFPLTRLPEFILGMLLARILKEGLWRPLRLRFIVPLPFLAIASLAVLPPVFAFGPYFALPVALLVTEFASRDIRNAPSPLRHPVMVYLGDRSFALYIIHYVTFMYVRWFVFGPTATFSTPAATAYTLLVMVPAALAAAWLLHRYVERPAVTYLGR